MTALLLEQPVQEAESGRFQLGEVRSALHDFRLRQSGAIAPGDIKAAQELVRVQDAEGASQAVVPEEELL